MNPDDQYRSYIGYSDEEIMKEVENRYGNDRLIKELINRFFLSCNMDRAVSILLANEANKERSN